VLLNYLARQQRDVQQPGVLTRAGELFARITHGRYRLLVEPGDPPGFRALDTSLGREQNLDPGLFMTPQIVSFGVDGEC
jgi:hypothetical protein